MKNAIVLLSMIFLMSLVGRAQASIAFEVDGEIIYEGDNAIALTSEYGEVTLAQNKVLELKCLEGRFTVVENYAPENTYSVIEVGHCQK